ncbi:replication protein, partial [Klebsiella pneumoniae]
MYANTQNTQATAERGVPRTHIAPSVDGGSLGIYTDNSANRTTQGFQPIRE